MNDIEELIQSLNGEEKEKEEKSISISEMIDIVKKYILVLWNKKWFVVIGTALGAIIGLTYTIFRTTTYTAHYSFTVGGSSSSGSGLSGITSLLNLGGGNMDAFSGDNVLELLRSNSLIEKTLLSPVCHEGDTITFIEYALICDSIRAKCAELEDNGNKKGVSVCDVEFPVGQDRETFSRAQDSILIEMGYLFKNKNIIAYRKDKKLSFMEYVFQYTDEDFAKKFSRAHLDAVSDFYVKTKTALARKNVESFQCKADSVRKSLDQCFARRAAYSDANRNANGQYMNVAQWKIDTDIQILSTTYTEMIKNIEMLKLDLAKETPLIQVIDEPRFPLSNDKVRKKKGFMVGGILAGFITCALILGWSILMDFKRKLDEESKATPNE